MKSKLYFITILLLSSSTMVCLAASSAKRRTTIYKENYRIFGGLNDSTTVKKLEIIPQSDNLFTTHYTCFFGGTIIVDYNLSTVLKLGVGLEFAHCKIHDDNGYELHNVNYWPIYLDSKLDVFRATNVTIFAHLSTGISFGSYTKEYPGTLIAPVNISSQGLYLYTGIGYSFKIYHYLQPVMEFGFKGFNLTFNQLDVNPHGLTLRVGFIITT